MSTANDQSSSPARSARRPYAAPEVARVNLKADEVLGIACKTLGWGNAKNQPCVITSCLTRGGS